MQQPERILPSAKIDATRLRTPANYAKEKRIPVRTVYWQIENDKIAYEKIDGVPFVKLT